MRLFNRHNIFSLTRYNGRMYLQQQPQVVCTDKLWYHRSVFHYFCQSGSRVWKIVILSLQIMDHCSLQEMKKINITLSLFAKYALYYG